MLKKHRQDVLANYDKNQVTVYCAAAAIGAIPADCDNVSSKGPGRKRGLIMNKLHLGGCAAYDISLFAMAFRAEAGVDAYEDRYAAIRKRMVVQDLKNRDIHDPAVLAAMEKVPRHLFVDERFGPEAYADHPLPIAESQTISQPYIVALMTQYLKLKKTDRVLEIGTGSGYQAAVLAELAGRVYTIELKKTLADQAGRMLRELGYSNVQRALRRRFFRLAGRGAL